MFVPGQAVVVATALQLHKHTHRHYDITMTGLGGVHGWQGRA